MIKKATKTNSKVPKKLKKEKSIGFFNNQTLHMHSCIIASLFALVYLASKQNKRKEKKEAQPFPL